MKNYLIFALIPIVLIVSYLITPYFVNNNTHNIPNIKSIDLPLFVKAKKYEKSNINVGAFIDIRAKQSPHRKIKHTIKSIDLEMIYIDKNNKICKINGRILHVGDSYKKITVIAIDKWKVLVKIGKRLRWLKLEVGKNEKI